MAKLEGFRRDLQTSKTPRTLAEQISRGRLAPMSWEQWCSRNTQSKHAGGYDVALRLAEPDKPDCGDKYKIDDGTVTPRRRTRALNLLEALWLMIERENHDDRVVVIGSNRPVVVWKIPDGLRTPVPSVCWPGASVAEAVCVQNSPALTRKSREMVLIRVRCRRFTKDRVERAAEIDQQMIEGRVSPSKHFGRKGNLSAFCLSAILEKCDAIERAHDSAEQFTGTPGT